jgi:very-short-patch-repair endonuclease
VANLRARALRWNMTEDERRLWTVLRRKNFAGFRFRRQHPLGPYVADFFCPKAKLVIELDGSQHAEEAQMRRDDARTRWLEERNYRVLRIWNGDLKREPKVIYDAICHVLEDPQALTAFYDKEE